MICLKNIKMNSMGNRVLISWLIIAIAFGCIGFMIGSTFSKSKSDYENCTAVNTKDVLIFGKLDGRMFNGELPISWEYGDSEFVSFDVPISEDLQEFTFYLSLAYDIDFTFVMALMKQESGFQSNIVSATNDYGLMQINEINQPYLKEQLEITDFLEPHDNIRAGMFILRKLFEKYETPEKVLMAYHMGETGASQLWEQGVFETNYSKTVLKYQQEFVEELERNGV